MPYGSSVKGASSRTTAYGSCDARPASTVSSPVIASTWPSWSSTRQPVWLSAPTGSASGASRIRLSMLDVPSGAQTRCPASEASPVMSDPLRTRIFCPDR